MNEETEIIKKKDENVRRAKKRTLYHWKFRMKKKTREPSLLAGPHWRTEEDQKSRSIMGKKNTGFCIEATLEKDISPSFQLPLLNWVSDLKIFLNILNFLKTYIVILWKDDKLKMSSEIIQVTPP